MDGWLDGRLLLFQVWANRSISSLLVSSLTVVSRINGLPSHSLTTPVSAGRQRMSKQKKGDGVFSVHERSALM